MSFCIGIPYVATSIFFKIIFLCSVSALPYVTVWPPYACLPPVYTLLNININIFKLYI